MLGIVKWVNIVVWCWRD